MGKLVAFWSPYVGQAKVTSSLCAITGGFGLQYPEVSLAVTHTQYASLELERKIDIYAGERERTEMYKKAGIAALRLQCQQSLLTSEKIRRSAIPLRMNSVYLYPYMEQKSEVDDLTYRLITEDLKQEFDAVFLDLESGRQKQSLRFLEAADFIVVILPQVSDCWQRFLKEGAEWLQGKKTGVLLGGYLEESKYCLNYYRRKKEYSEIGELLGAIPINAGFLDAMSEGKTMDYFYRNQKVKKTEVNYGFIVQTTKAAENIRKKILLP